MSTQSIMRLQRLQIFAARGDVTIFAILIASIMMAILFLSYNPLLNVVSWLALCTVICVFRLLHIRWYRQQENKIRNYRVHELAMGLGMLSTGLAWGIGIVLFSATLPRIPCDILFVLLDIYILRFKEVRNRGDFLLFNNLLIIRKQVRRMLRENP